MMINKKLIFLLFVYVLINVSESSPIPNGQDNVQVNLDGSSVKLLQGQENIIKNCIPTPYGCIDISDPAFRPKIGDGPGHSKCPCIPVPGWGCIDPCDPSVRP
ncbi:uncharacterized protein LOC126741230 [Anthonomus grandis grandis]|uniref:uncharacterized protein LOC126741230 n=1 Tax=Anthonomus grandis grandis TaxID=2921223 RepID=UPI0021660464|nr:uncharacterized protein LOC126741230 [Anthonomus grandis grandis]